MTTATQEVKTWQMTLDLYIDQEMGSHGHLIAGKGPAKEAQYRECFAAQWTAAVTWAIERGDSVPADVLAGYVAPPRMEKAQADAMADLFSATKKFTSVLVVQVGGEFAAPTNPWTVELWHVNSRAGNRTVHVVKEYQPKLVPSIARLALGKATARDAGSLARAAAERAINRE